MNEDQLTIVKDTIQVVEQCMRSNVNLEEISKKVGLSKYHLHRLFRSITDKSLMSYIRCRRLSLSLHELINTNLKILDIAGEYQFEHEQSYIRAFKQQYHMTPAQYRKHPCELGIEQKIDLKQLTKIGQGILIKPHMCICPMLYLQGIEREIVHEQNYNERTANQLAEEFWYNYRPLIPNVKSKGVFIGMVRYRENQGYSNNYATCVETTKPNTSKAPFVQYTIPAQEYAVFRYIGFHTPQETTYQTLYELYGQIDQWVLETEYKQEKPYHLEIMDVTDWNIPYCEMNIYIPIQT